MKTKLLLVLLLTPFTLLFSQQWQQLAGEPEGGGVTDIYVDESTGDLFVATGSLNWPSGEDGGLRKSTDDGATWVNIFDAYTSRFIQRGPDQYLYASVWDYPLDEGFYRSEDEGNTWSLLTSVPTGNNIFAFAIKEGLPNIIFLGTGQGVMRSLDNGVNWAYANSGLPANTLVRSMAVSPDGNTIAAGTVNGMYVSSDDGDTWEKVTGDGESEIITSIAFDEDPTKSGMPTTNMIFGSESGKVFLATSLTLFTVAVLYATLVVNSGLTRIMAHRHPTTLVPIFMASLYAATGGAFYYAIAGLSGWQPWMTGLPSNPMISMFTSYLIVSTAIIVMYIAMYGNSKAANSGSEIYKATFDISTGVALQPYTDQRLTLHQNIPNPFREQTRIQFELSDAAYTVLDVFDMAGNKVLSLVDGMMSKGNHDIDLAGERLSRGIYYYTLRSNNQVETKKLVVQ